MIDLDKFNRKFSPTIKRSVWGHGESGYELVLFSSHDENEVKKARDYLFDLILKYEQAKSWDKKL